MGEINKTLSQEKIEEIVGEQVKSGMTWEFFIVAGVLLLPVLILEIAGIYAVMPFLLKLGMWLVLYITYYKCENWVVARKVRHTLRDMREATGV